MNPHTGPWGGAEVLVLLIVVPILLLVNRRK